jgi:CDP-paratose 2-epimerase
LAGEAALKILITGVCGFVGSRIARGLREAWPQASIFGIDNFLRRGSSGNLEPLRSIGIDVRRGDIRFRSDLEALPDADWVIDCAANPSVLAGVDGRTGPRELLDHNLVGTLEVLEYCRTRSAGFLLLSTSRVYSLAPLSNLPVDVKDEAFHPVSSGFPPGFGPAGVAEEFSTQPPVSLYGNSKLCSESLALEYGASFDFPVWINRCGVLAGPGQFGRADQGIFSFWIHAWAERAPLKMIGFGGRGYQVRDCLNPDDLVPLLMAQMQDPGRLAPRIVNVSGGIDHAMSLAQLSAWCAARFGPHEVLSEPEMRPFDIPWMVLDSGKARMAWNWSPTQPLAETLEAIARHAESTPGWLDRTR